MKRIKAFDTEAHKSFRILNRSENSERYFRERREQPRLQKWNDWFIWKFSSWVALPSHCVSPDSGYLNPFFLISSTWVPTGLKWSRRYITQVDDWFMVRVILEILNFPGHSEISIVFWNGAKGLNVFLRDTSSPFRIFLFYPFHTVASFLRITNPWKFLAHADKSI